MAALEMERVGAGRLDIEDPEAEVNDGHLAKALHAHLYALHIQLERQAPTARGR